VLVMDVSNGTVINNTVNATCNNETGALLTVFDTENTTILNPPVLNFSNLTIRKLDYPDPVNVSSYLNYTIIVNSTGNGTAYNVTVNDTYPLQVIYVSSQPAPVGGTNNTWFFSEITNGTAIHINITVLTLNVNNGTIINNTVNVTYQNATGAFFMVNTTENTTIEVPPVILNFSNMTIVKTDSPDPVVASQNLTYQVNVSSTGNGTTYNVTVNETYPEQVIYLTSQPSPVIGKNNTWVLGNLTPGRNISINITVLVRNITNGTTINNTANVTFQNATGSVIVLGALAQTLVLNPPVFNISNISIAKTDSPDPVTQGGQLNYTIIVTSTGNGTAYNVTLNDTYPEQVVYDSAQPAPITGTNNTFVIGNLTPGTTVRINISVIVNADLPNDTIINNTANVTWQNETGILLSGSAGASTNVSNITPPTPPPPPSGGGGGGGGRKGVIIEPEKENVTLPCVENWVCDEWTECTDRTRSRNCYDLNNCGTTTLMPQTRLACIPKPAPKPAIKPEKQEPKEIVTDKKPEKTAQKSIMPTAIINMFKAVLWPFVFTIVGIIVITIVYASAGRKKQEPKTSQKLPLAKNYSDDLNARFRDIDKRLKDIDRMLDSINKGIPPGLRKK
ncbi:MAG: DUF11 domain-containing protein, partial [Candidatus Woesearchaeota archaeon]